MNTVLSVTQSAYNAAYAVDNKADVTTKQWSVAIQKVTGNSCLALERFAFMRASYGVE